MRIRTLAGTIVAIAAGWPLAAAAAPDEQPLAGVWQKREYTLAYAGFTSHYSCDGIADKIRLLLLAAGARDDLKVRGSCTEPRGGPSRISTARATFYTLAPEAAAATAGAAAEPVARAPGVWKAVVLKDGEPKWLEAGDCELVEQFDQELLPLFTTRNRDSRMTCVPHQYQLGAIALRFEVFAALPKPRSAAPTP